MDFSHTIGFPYSETMTQPSGMKWYKETLTKEEQSCIWGQAEKLRKLYKDNTKQMVYIFEAHTALPQSETVYGITQNYKADWGDLYLEELNHMASKIPITVVSSDPYPEKTYDIQCKKFNLEKTEIKFISRTQWYINWLLSRQLRGTTGTIDYNCSKLLVIMNGKVTTPRLLVMAKLVSTGLLERTHWSWLAEQEHGNGLDFPIKPKFGFDVKKRKMLGDSRHTDASAHPIPAEYFDSYIDIPVESFVDPDAVFISEKTLRPYLCCKPSLCLNAYGHHGYLESIGIKHYTELFDYDKVEQPSLTKRVKGIIDNLVKLSELSNYDLDKKIKSIEDKIIHNKEIILSQPRTKMPTPELQHLTDRGIYPTDGAHFSRLNGNGGWL